MIIGYHCHIFLKSLLCGFCVTLQTHPHLQEWIGFNTENTPVAHSLKCLLTNFRVEKLLLQEAVLIGSATMILQGLIHATSNISNSGPLYIICYYVNRTEFKYLRHLYLLFYFGTSDEDVKLCLKHVVSAEVSLWVISPWHIYFCKITFLSQPPEDKQRIASKIVWCDTITSQSPSRRMLLKGPGGLLLSWLV